MRIRRLFPYTVIATAIFLGCTEPVTEPEAVDAATSGDPEVVLEAIGAGEIAFATNWNLDPDIYAAKVDGSDPVNLSGHPALDREPAWSPDGENLAFVSTRTGGDRDIFIMDVDAPAVVRQITRNGARERNPSWSPDGRKIAFRSNVDGDDDIYVIDVDGSGEWIQLTTHPAFDSQPTWSPDGSRIAFSRKPEKSDGDWDIYVMNADGSGEPRQLTDDPGMQSAPDWSPAGRRIAFHSDQYGNLDIFLINADGSGKTPITRGPGIDQHPDWSPTGTHVVFSRIPNGNADIYIVGADGSNPIRVTHNNNAEIQPSWGPGHIGLVVRSLDATRSRIGDSSGQPYGFAGSPGFRMARELLEERFPRISFEGVPEVTEETLVGADVFVINQLDESLKSAEVCALEVFVNHGGALVEARDLGNRSAILGTVPGERRADPSPRIVNGDRPPLAGPFGFIDTGLTTGPNFAYSEIGEAIPITENSAGPNIIELEAAAGRKGLAVFIGDDEFFMNGDFPGERTGQLDNRRNQTVLLNTFAFLAGAPGLEPGADFSACANQAPTGDAGGPYTAAEGSPTIVFDGSAADPDGDAIRYDWDFGDGTRAADAGPTPSHTYPSDDATYAATLTIADGGTDSQVATDDAVVTIRNEAPTLSALTVSSDPVAVGTRFEMSATFTDPGALDTHTVIVDWGDGSTSAAAVTESNGSGSASASHSYAAAGVYTLTATLRGDDGAEDRSMFQYAVVYDPEAGFITGGGWITSPAGAYPAVPTATGKATFGFVSKYLEGAGTPSGNTQFKLHVVGLSFHASSYDWLVIKGPRARYTGHGSLNGEDGYAFMLSAIDGALVDGGGEDALRIKIWDADTGAVVYDSEIEHPEDLYAATELGGGSIVIHKK